MRTQIQSVLGVSCDKHMYRFIGVQHLASSLRSNDGTKFMDIIFRIEHFTREILGSFVSVFWIDGHVDNFAVVVWICWKFVEDYVSDATDPEPKTTDHTTRRLLAKNITKRKLCNSSSICSI